MKDKIDLKKEKDSVENYIITAQITLSAAFIVLFSINESENNYVSLSAIISLFCLLTSLCLFLWNKYRYSIRYNLFQLEKEKKFNDVASNIADFMETFVDPKIKSSNYRKEEQDQAKKVIKTNLENLNFQMKESNNKIFKNPLPESHSKIKFRLDYVSRHTRYPLFIAGIIFFFISLFLSLT